MWAIGCFPVLLASIAVNSLHYYGLGVPTLLICAATVFLAPNTYKIFQEIGPSTSERIRLRQVEPLHQ